MRQRLIGAIVTALAFLPSAASAQATTRLCGAIEEAGPACLLARKPLPSLPAGKVFWHIDRFPSRQTAESASTAAGVVVEAFGSTWLFTLAERKWRSNGGTSVSVIGPLPVAPASTYTAEYLRSIFVPGTTAPLHVHSGPEAFFLRSPAIPASKRRTACGRDAVRVTA